MRVWAKLVWRLLLRPLAREPARAALTALAVSLGVAVVVAIDLAGEASTGSFRSSLDNLSGKAQFEISAVGGLDERLLGRLTSLPYPLRFSARVEGFALVGPARLSVPIFGVDLIGDPLLDGARRGDSFSTERLTAADSVWVGRKVARKSGERLRFIIGDRAHEFTVAGVLSREGFPGVVEETLAVFDIALAQRLLSKLGKLDRIDVYLPEADDGKMDWQALLGANLPEGVALAPSGARLDENRKMLAAFGWNLRILSWISLIVGAFLIYNAISVSVLRRRGEIGVLRALGATRGWVARAFLIEAALLGAIGTLVGLALGRMMADGAVGMMARTVQALYLSSAPGEIRFRPAVLATALLAGVGVSLVAALGPAREAARIPPTEAMARGRRAYLARLRTGRDLALSALLAAAAGAACFAPPVGGLPVFGYLAALLLIASSALAVPAAVNWLARLSSRPAARLLGVGGLLASRSLLASLDRTAVLVAALSTATAMLVSIAVMVGSFRETVVVWMDNQLRADFYISPAGRGGADRYPTMAPEVADAIEALDEVEAVDRFRAYPIRFRGLPATLAGGETRVHGRAAATRFLSGESDEIFRKLQAEDAVIVSEPFASKHGVGPGDRITLPLAGRKVDFEVAGVYYDYSNEHGFLIADRERLLAYLPDPRPSNLAVYLKPGEDLDKARAAIAVQIGARELFVATNRRLREGGLRVFDRTFAITYALEAVAIAVAVVGMAGALLALVIDRRREIGLLRFLGASAGQVRRLILIESGLLGLLANLIGAALGTLLSLILIFVINKQSFGWTIQFHWPAALLGAALTLIYAATIAAGAYPARTAVRLNPIEVIHEE